MPNDTNFSQDVFLHDRTTSETFRVSLSATGGEGLFGARRASLSADGCYSVFESVSTDLIPGGTNGTQHIFIRAVPIVTVTSVVPDILHIGDTTPNQINGSYFLSGAQPILNGASVSNVTIVNENTITADIDVDPGSSEGAQDLLVGIPGTGPGVNTGSLGACTDCVTFTPGC